MSCNRTADWCSVVDTLTSVLIVDLESSSPTHQWRRETEILQDNILKYFLVVIISCLWMVGISLLPHNNELRSTRVRE